MKSRFLNWCGILPSVIGGLAIFFPVYFIGNLDRNRIIETLLSRLKTNTTNAVSRMAYPENLDVEILVLYVYGIHIMARLSTRQEMLVYLGYKALV